MVEATFRLWDRGRALVSFTLRARRIDPELAAELAEVDTMCRMHLSVICRRLGSGGRLRIEGASEAAADLAFAVSTPTVYEDLVKARGWPVDRAAATIADIVIDAIVDPDSAPAVDPSPDWGALGLGATRRAR